MSHATELDLFNESAGNTVVVDHAELDTALAKIASEGRHVWAWDIGRTSFTLHVRSTRGRTVAEILSALEARQGIGALRQSPTSSSTQPSEGESLLPSPVRVRSMTLNAESRLVRSTYQVPSRCRLFLQSGSAPMVLIPPPQVQAC